MARRLAQTLPRRTVIEGSAGAWVLAALRRDQSGLAEGKRTRRGRVAACTRNGKTCGRGRKLTPCAKCCSGFNVTTRSKKKKCACRPDGMDCNTPAQCCAGICSDRICGALS